MHHRHPGLHRGSGGGQRAANRRTPSRISNQVMNNTAVSGTPPAARAATLAIPIERQSFSKFTEEVREAVARPDTHFYLDTSFLVWMTTLGKVARGELVGWIGQLGRERFHVPVWSG